MDRQPHAEAPAVPRPQASRTGEVEVRARQAQDDQAMEEAAEDLPRGPFYALRFRNFRLFFVGQLISVAGSWMQIVAQQWLVYDITHDARWLGIISGASAIPYVAFAAWGGQLADKRSRRGILVWTQTAAMTCGFIMAALATNHWIPIQAWHIAVLAGVLGVINAFNMPAQQAFVTDIVDTRAALANAIALNSLRFNLARFIGPIMAGAVLVKLGSAMCFLLDAISFIAVIICLLLMRIQERTGRQDHETSALDGFRYIAATPAVLRVISLLGVASLFAWSVSTIFPVIADLFGRGATGYSVIMTVNGVGAAIGGAVMTFAQDRFSRRIQVYAGAALFGAGLLALAAAPNYVTALVCLLVSGFAMIIFSISANTKVQKEVPDRLRGRVMAVYSLVFAGLAPVGGLQIGYLTAQVGTRPAVAVNAALCLVATAALAAWSAADHRTRRISETH